MMQLTPQTQLFLSIRSTDFRKGIDALIALCQQQLEYDPYSGVIFIFTNRRRTAIKLLAYDGNGFWLCLKRFSQGTLKWWPSKNTEALTYHITATELTILMNQGDPGQSSLGEPWRRLKSQPKPIRKK